MFFFVVVVVVVVVLVVVVAAVGMLLQFVKAPQCFFNQGFGKRASACVSLARKSVI